MSLFQIGQKISARWPAHIGLVEEGGKIFLQFGHELTVLEIAAIRDFVVESLSSPRRSLFFAGVCHIRHAFLSPETSRRTRLIFAVQHRPFSCEAERVLFLEEVKTLLASEKSGKTGLFFVESGHHFSETRSF